MRLTQRGLRTGVAYLLRWRSMAVLILLLFTATVYTVVYAQEPSPEFDLNQVTPPTSPPLAIAGESIYQQSCAPCHGAQGVS